MEAFLGALNPSLLDGADLIHTAAGRLPTVEVLAVLHHFTRLLAHGRWGAPLRHAARDLGAHLPVVTIGERRGFVLEHASLAVRAALLDSALLLWARWSTSFSVLCAEHRVWHSALLADFRRAPSWYRRRIRSELYLPGFVPPPSVTCPARSAAPPRQHEIAARGIGTAPMPADTVPTGCPSAATTLQTARTKVKPDRLTRLYQL